MGTNLTVAFSPAHEFPSRDRCVVECMASGGIIDIVIAAQVEIRISMAISARPWYQVAFV